MSYYVIPFESLPVGPPYGEPPYEVYYAAWSTAHPTVFWHTTLPNIKPDGKSTWVLGVVKVVGALPHPLPSSARKVAIASVAAGASTAAVSSGAREVGSASPTGGASATDAPQEDGGKDLPPPPEALAPGQVSEAGFETMLAAWSSREG